MSIAAIFAGSDPEIATLPSPSCCPRRRERRLCPASRSFVPSGCVPAAFALATLRRSHTRRSSGLRCCASFRASACRTAWLGEECWLRLRSSCRMIFCFSAATLRACSRARRCASSSCSRRRCSSSRRCRSSSATSSVFSPASGSGAGMGGVVGVVNRPSPRPTRSTASCHDNPRALMRKSMGLLDPTNRPASERSTSQAKEASTYALAFIVFSSRMKSARTVWKSTSPGSAMRSASVVMAVSIWSTRSVICCVMSPPPYDVPGIAYTFEPTALTGTVNPRLPNSRSITPVYSEAPESGILAQQRSQPHAENQIVELAEPGLSHPAGPVEQDRRRRALEAPLLHCCG